MSSFFPDNDAQRDNHSDITPDDLYKDISAFDDAPEALKPALRKMIDIVKPAHEITRAVAQGKLELANDLATKYAAQIKNFNLEDDDVVSAIMSTLLAGSTVLSPRMYGGDEIDGLG